MNMAIEKKNIASTFSPCKWEAANTGHCVVPQNCWFPPKSPIYSNMKEIMCGPLWLRNPANGAILLRSIIICLAFFVDGWTSFPRFDNMRAPAALSLGQNRVSLWAAAETFVGWLMFMWRFPQMWIPEKWMVYHGKSIKKWMIWGTSGNLHIGHTIQHGILIIGECRKKTHVSRFFLRRDGRIAGARFGRVRKWYIEIYWHVYSKFE